MVSAFAEDHAHVNIFQVITLQFVLNGVLHAYHLRQKRTIRSPTVVSWSMLKTWYKYIMALKCSSSST